MGCAIQELAATAVPVGKNELQPLQQAQIQNQQQQQQNQQQPIYNINTTNNIQQHYHHHHQNQQLQHHLNHNHHQQPQEQQYQQPQQQQQITKNVLLKNNNLVAIAQQQNPPIQQQQQHILSVKSQQLKQQHASLVKLLESAPITGKILATPIITNNYDILVKTDEQHEHQSIQQRIRLKNRNKILHQQSQQIQPQLKKNLHQHHSTIY